MKKIKPFLIKKELGYILNSDKKKMEADLEFIVIENINVDFYLEKGMCIYIDENVKTVYAFPVEYGDYEVLEDYDQDNNIIKELNDKIYSFEKEIKEIKETKVQDCNKCKDHMNSNEESLFLENTFLKQEVKKLEQYILKQVREIIK